MGVCRFFALLQFGLIEARLQHGHGRGAILVLRTLLLAGNDDAGRHVRDADGRVGRVDVLAASARRTIGVNLEVALADLDVDRVIDHWIDPAGREAGMPPRRRIVGADADETMDAAFRLEPAIGIMPLDQNRGGLDAGFFAVVHFEHFDLHLPPFSPARIHAQEHVGPVLRLGATGA